MLSDFVDIKKLNVYLREKKLPMVSKDDVESWLEEQVYWVSPDEFLKVVLLKDYDEIKDGVVKFMEDKKGEFLRQYYRMLMISIAKFVGDLHTSDKVDIEEVKAMFVTLLVGLAEVEEGLLKGEKFWDKNLDDLHTGLVKDGEICVTFKFKGENNGG